jgi:hypothetical protein
MAREVELAGKQEPQVSRLPAGLLVATLVLAIVVPGALYWKLNRVLQTSIPAHDSRGFQSGLDECRVDAGSLFVRGWAFVEEETGVRQIRVYAVPERGRPIRVPSRVERRDDLPTMHGRPVEHDALHDGFSAASSMTGLPAAPLRIVLQREDHSGRTRGDEHACE